MASKVFDWVSSEAGLQLCVVVVRFGFWESSQLEVGRRNSDVHSHILLMEEILNHLGCTKPDK